MAPRPLLRELAQDAVGRSRAPRALLEWGERPLLVVRAIADAESSLQELRERLTLDYCDARLGEISDDPATVAGDVARVLAAALRRH